MAQIIRNIKEDIISLARYFYGIFYPRGSFDVISWSNEVEARAALVVYKDPQSNTTLETLLQSADPADSVEPTELPGSIQQCQPTKQLRTARPRETPDELEAYRAEVLRFLHEKLEKKVFEKGRLGSVGDFETSASGQGTTAEKTANSAVCVAAAAPGD